MEMLVAGVSYFKESVDDVRLERKKIFLGGIKMFSVEVIKINH